MTALEILDALNRHQSVSRWDCNRLKRELRQLTATPEFKHLELDVESQIELAKDSL